MVHVVLVSIWGEEYIYMCICADDSLKMTGSSTKGSGESTYIAEHVNGSLVNANNGSETGKWKFYLRLYWLLTFFLNICRESSGQGR